MAGSRQLHAAARLSADRASDRGRVASPEPVVTTVTTVTAGAARDGAATVAVTIRDSQVTVAGYPDTYTPAVGHRVKCSYVGAQLFIDYRIIGAP